MPHLLSALALLIVAAHSGSHRDTVPGFLSDRQTVWLDRTQMLPVVLAHPTDEDRELEVAVEHADVVEVVRQPLILAGESTGYLRVRGLAEGQTRLFLGPAVAHVRVQPVPESASVNRMRARITTPVEGAVVWGDLTVGVDITLGSMLDERTTVWLELPDGRRASPVGEPRNRHTLRSGMLFDVDTRTLSPGPADLRVRARRETGELISSRPVRVTVVHPRPGDLLAGECEEQVEAPRPRAFGGRRPAVGSGGGASGDAFVVNETRDRAWLLPVDVEEPGHYQVVLVARGDFGAGAYPSVAVSVDEPSNAITAGVIGDSRWRRTTIGFPIALARGEHTLSFTFANESPLSNRSDRGLFLDRYELLRLPDHLLEPAAEPVGRYDALSAGGDRLLVSFDQPFEGPIVNEQLTIRGLCRWHGAGLVTAPRVDLILNGERVATQQAARPSFRLDRGAFERGANTVQMVAELTDGTRARTPVQIVHIEGGTDRPAREVHRVTVVGDLWREALSGLLSDERALDGHSSAYLSQGTRVELPLPDELSGELELLLEVHGPERGLAGRMHVALLASGTEVSLQTVNVSGRWSDVDAGRVKVAAGPKSLVLEVPAEAPADSARTIRLNSLYLRTTRDEEETTPRLVVRYPSSGHEASLVDAVVVEAWTEKGELVSGDVQIDGAPQGTMGYVPSDAGHLVLPLVLRGIAPGPHRIAVRIANANGDVAWSEEIPITVTDGSEPSTYARAVHLLDRFGYGPEPQELADLLVLGERAWLEQRLGPRENGEEVALHAARTEMGYPEDKNVTRAVLWNVLRTPNPVRARFTFWLENHFSTCLGKARGPQEWAEHEEFLRLGPAPFGELLVASATSPAMLVYLDQVASYAARLNENYAREIMELHTLGVHGGYTQAEVTSLASVLAGLTIADVAAPNGSGDFLTRQPVFDPELGEGRARDILGFRFEETPPPARYARFLTSLELLAAHPSTARHVARSLAEHYTSAPADDELVDDLAQVFVESGGDLRSMLLALAEHDVFWRDLDAPRLANPFDYAARLVRTTGGRGVEWAIIAYLEQSDMGIFDRATPDGYPEEDEAWADSNITLQRLGLVQQIPWVAWKLAPYGLRRAPAGDPLAWIQRVLDVVAVRLTGRLLDDASNDAALAYLSSLEARPEAIVDEATMLVCRLPEAGLR